MYKEFTMHYSLYMPLRSYSSNDSIKLIEMVVFKFLICNLRFLRLLKIGTENRYRNVNLRYFHFKN